MWVILVDVLGLKPWLGAIECMLTESRRVAARNAANELEGLQQIGIGLLMRAVLCIDKDDHIRRDKNGKPHISNEWKHGLMQVSGLSRFFPLEISLSHSGNYSALAIHNEALGIDIEPLEQPPRINSERVFTEAERYWLNESNTPERFLTLWTRKEAALKANGSGFLADPREFDTVYGDERFFWSCCHDSHVISCATKRRTSVMVKLLDVEAVLGLGARCDLDSVSALDENRAYFDRILREATTEVLRREP